MLSLIIRKVRFSWACVPVCLFASPLLVGGLLLQMYPLVAKRLGVLFNVLGEAERTGYYGASIATLVRAVVLQAKGLGWEQRRVNTSE
jgi:hypothetical protein